MTKKKAFTLIELLVVIAIIALLLSIIMPSLKKTKKQAQFIICKTNLKNYGLAGVMYIQNNDDCFPDSYTWLHADGDEGMSDVDAWHNKSYKADGIMWPYLESQDVHMCPTFYRWAKIIKCTAGSHNPNIPIEPQYSYSMNSYLGHGIWFSPEKVKKISEIAHPAEMLFFSEENMWNIPGRSQYFLNNNNLHMRLIGSDLKYLINNIATFHKMKGNDKDSGIANIVFADGHVDSGDNDDGYILATPVSQRIETP